ncbi:hypothetical protein ACFPM7_12450 [Actinokineospora guangxiensis]|uniref:Uncharacterized protein n=1 Tax=Actinokineospora guangxiensis TaxID=1490288 RepID=A0ABW0EPD4_9PSEU
MALLSRLRARVGARVARTRIGAALVVHPVDGISDEAGALAGALPADPHHDLVVMDLPAVSPIEVWQAFAGVLPRGRGPVRVVPGRAGSDIPPYAWQWLADRSNRPVTAPYGVALHLAGAVFVPGEGAWVDFGKETAPRWAGKRFPAPAWESVELGRTRTVGLRGVAEPLPAGVWLRPDVAPDALAPARDRLTMTLPRLRDTPIVALGARDAVDLTVAEVAAFWRTLPADAAAAVRFTRYGALSPADDAAFGQELANAVGAEVCVYTGVPVAGDVLALRQDGSLGARVFAQAYAYRPGGLPVGRLAAHRAPAPGLSEVAAGVYWYAPDVVVEVVRAGLWVRPAEQTGDPAGVRAAPLDPMHTLLVHESSDPARAERLRDAAVGVMNLLDESTLPQSRLIASTVLAGTHRRVLAAKPAPEPAVPELQALHQQALHQPAPEQHAADDETDLPWLSRLMETVSIPFPAAASEEAVHGLR